jgi:hypothetical protein
MAPPAPESGNPDGRSSMNERTERGADETAENGYEPPALSRLGPVDDVTLGDFSIGDSATDN